MIGYLVVIAATLLTFARLADIAGRERVWIGGLALFTAGSALSGLAPTLVLLVATRAIQGLGAAMIFAPALALIVDLFPASQRGMALLAPRGLWGLLTSRFPMAPFGIQRKLVISPPDERVHPTRVTTE